MTDPVAKRPPTLVGACIYLGALAAILSVRAATLVTTWNGEDRARDLDLVLDALRDAGLSQAGAENGYKVFLTIVAVLAACAAVFAIYTARGDRVSRIGLTVSVGIAGTVAFLGFLSGGFLYAMIGALVVVFSIRLWTGEIRTYFRTLAGHAPPPPKAPDVSATAAPTADPFVQQPVPPAQPPAPQTPPPPYGYAPPPPGYQQWHAAPRREPFPRAVSIAVWTVFVGSVVAAGLSALMLLVLAVGGLDYDTLIEQGGAGADMIRNSSRSDFETAARWLTLISSVSLALGIAGVLASVRALTKRRAGGVPLFVMTVVTIVVSVIFIPFGIPWTVAASIALWQLLRPESKAWFSRT